MRNFWLDRRNPLSTLIVINEYGDCERVTLYYISPKDYLRREHVPCVNYIASSKIIYILTQTLDHMDQIVEQIFLHYNPKNLSKTERFSKYYLKEILI